MQLWSCVLICHRALTGNTELLEKANIKIDDKTWTWDGFKEISKKLKELVDEEYVAFINLFPIQMLAEYIEVNYERLSWSPNSAY